VRDRVVAGVSVGLDVGAKFADIRRLTRTHPLWRVAVARGLDPDDVLQSVVLGLLTRQQGRSRYDPARASFSRYVYLVAGSVIANLLDSQRGRDRREVLGDLDDAARSASGEAVDDEADLVVRLFALLVSDGHEPRIVLLLVDGGSVAVARRRRGGQLADSIAARIRSELGAGDA